MRDMNKYPVEYDEAVSWLEDQKRMIEAENKSLSVIGDARPMVIEYILEELWIREDMKES